MIRLQSINKFYKQGPTNFHVLKDISFNIAAGEFVSIMGPSGSGKSTLINIIGFLDDQFEGDYWFMGDNIREKTRREYTMLRNRNVGFIFQNFKLIDTVSVAENIGLPLIYAGKRRKEIRSEVQQVLTRVGLPNLGTKKPRDLSGGQQQRVAIARAVITKPNFLIADEPTGALDSRNSAEILELFQKLNQENHTTIIMVTHDQNVANQSQRIIRILDGAIESDEEVIS